MKTSSSLLIAGILGASALASHAAIVTWGAATNVAGDSDVSTAGTLVNAVNLGNGFPTATTTVNGVTFNGTNFSATITSGNFTFTGLSIGSSAPFAGLSPQYNTLLTNNVGGSAMSLTMSSLTVGSSYQFQFWNSNPAGASGVTTAAAGNSVALNSTAGGFGQFALGTFTADAASQVITFANGVNGAQLRLLPAASAVPEPGSALAGMLALGVCLGGLGSRQRGKVRAA